MPKPGRPRTRDRSGSRPESGRAAREQQVNSSNTASFAASAELKSLVARPDTPAAAKVNALRALAEIEGLIGRHQDRPTRTQEAGLQSLSRDELVAELARLRELVSLGLIG